MKTIMLTGGTGLIGGAALRLFVKEPEQYHIRLLARPSKKNRKKLKKYIDMPCVTVIWGDLTNTDDVSRALGDASIVLHLGGMVPPECDPYPELTMKVNTVAARNVVDAVKSRPDADDIRLVYMGSIAQMSHHDEPVHWGRAGDPLAPAVYDYYGLSKILAERIVVESGLKHWVSIRESGVLHPGLLSKGLDPISFTVPLRGVLEWSTLEDSARLLVNICSDNVPESFWRGFYNISSGPEFRLSNYDFECLMLKALGCPPPEKAFLPHWFATRNFHGTWYTDSDLLNELVPFREGVGVEEYFRRLSSQLPFYYKFAPLAPAWIIRKVMHYFGRRGGAILSWFDRDDREKEIMAFWGSRERHGAIPSWQDFDRTPPSAEPVVLDHGYDESKKDSELCIEDMTVAARFRGGECLSESMIPGDLDTPLHWRCAYGHEFELSPRAVLKGGHWCKECLPAPWRYDAEARVNPYLAQVWYAAHTKDEDNVYD